MTRSGVDARVVVRRPRFVLDAHVSVAAGEVLAIMGPSGAGKSTLLDAIAGLVRLDDGRVRVDGRVVADRTSRVHVRSAARGVGVLGQQPRLFPHLTVRENVAFGPRSRGVPRSAARRAADELLWRVGLPGAGGHRPDELSGGQQQRVAVARALATEPGVLLLDEPLTALDPETAGDVRTMLHEQILATHAAVLLVTHDAVDAAALASRLAVIEDGRITQHGSVGEVFHEPRTRFAAALSGVNRLEGRASGGLWVADPSGGPARLSTTDVDSRARARGQGAPIAAIVRPADVRLEPVPDVSWTGALARVTQDGEAGTWPARVVRVERTLGGARVHVADPPLAAEVAVERIAEQGLAPGSVVRVRVPPEAVRFVAR